MANVKTLLAEQATEVDEFSKVLRNYNKDGSVRKTMRYLKDKLSEIDESFRVITQNHQTLLPLIDDNQPYVQQKIYETIEKKYRDVRANIEFRLNDSTSQSQPPTPSTKTIEKQPEEEINDEHSTPLINGMGVENNIQSTSSEKNTNGIDNIDQSTIANTPEKLNDATPTDLLQILYDDFLDIIATSRDINAETSIGSVHAHLEILNSMWLELRKIICDHRAAGKAISFSYSTLLQKYMNVSGKLNDFFRPSASSNSESQRSNAQFSLPKIELPKFTGKPSEWQGFIALFDRMIHNNMTIDRGMKVEYLKSCVKDSAAKIINHLDPTPSNYDTCYALLRKRYDNKRELVNCMLENVITLPKMKSESADSLKTMHDTVYESLMAIKNLGVNNEELFEFLICYILIKKLDNATLMNYECQLTDVRELPKINSFLSYIENRFMALQSVGVKTHSFNEKFQHEKFQNEKTSFEKKSKCILCEGEHALYKCQSFLKKSARERSEFVKEKKFCLNCLASSSHKPNECKSKYKCKTCQRLHHSLLHFETKKAEEKSLKSNVARIQSASNEPATIQAHVSIQKSGSVLLATAMIGVLGKNGSTILLRALLDQGSQSAFITENAAQTLNLQRKTIHAVITGIGATAQHAKHSIDLTIFPRFESDFVINSDAIVLPKLTKISHCEYTESDFGFINNLTLADPSFLKESEIDIILGAAEYAQALKMGLIKSEKNLLAQNTEFGWIVSGAINSIKPNVQIITLVTNVDLTQQMNRLFANDDFDNVDGETLTEEEAMCESHYASTHSRNESGRYVVSLPFKNGLEKPDLGDSKKIALASLFSLERRFASRPELRKQYSDFIIEYVKAGHMREVTTHHPDAHYLPHHCVFKDSTTTKLRVVFNASQKTSNKKCLNEQLALGPMDQNDLLSIIIRWRRHRIAFTADVEKMYRQILVNDSQTHLQRILWRKTPKDPIKEYELTTVTYGTANAPFLAIRTLKQLALDGSIEYPNASQILKSDFYVDDVLSGADSIAQAQNLYRELKNLMNSACFNLRKWTSNSTELLETIPIADREIQSNNGVIKALGVAWSPEADEFTFDLSFPDDNIPTTKRQLTSEIASLYDPLGWICPIVISAKHILQQLWSENLDWDAPIPNKFVQPWLKIKNEIELIKQIRIPRWISYSPNEPMELHGFCDASELGYSAVIYIKNLQANTAHLLVAKARVSPIKESKNCDNVTIPRLELCGALMLAQLVKKVLSIMEINFNRVCLWSDSRIVLDWIHANPRRYKIFIASRITKINKLVEKHCWSHVRSEDNAADCASRGILPSELISHPLWWHGPKFLVDNSLEPPRYRPQMAVEAVMEQIAVNAVGLQVTLPNVSSYYKLKRIIACCLRFSFNCKNINKRKGVISLGELKIAELAIIKFVQKECFADEIRSIKNKGTVRHTSPLLKLNPFLDDKQILRVGGRIKNADIPYEAKHQILLPSKHFVTALIIKNIHLSCLHGAPKLTESILRQKFWVLQSQRTIKSTLRQCINCFKVNPKTMTQFMADLPSQRVNAFEKPFTNTAVDYTGAFLVKFSNGRGFRSHKSYVSIFVCMATKAMHIELVSDLTAEAFVAAYRRFVARRGVVRNIYSDNGTNFVKSNKILSENMKNIDLSYDNAICEELSKSGTNWHFSPPGAPHFNGLAEAAVKTVKLHIKKTIADTILTFEEFGTLLAQIEACVNSRPLCALSNDPNDVSALTPAHFLVGEPLILPPEQNHLEAKASWLTRWQRIQKMTQFFWKRWQADYLNQLQVRTKWLKEGKAPEKDDLVLIRDENLPSTQWQTGRVVETHPGTDGLTRVVTLKTKNGLMKRPIAKLCAFPNDEGEIETPNNKEIGANIAKIVHRKSNTNSGFLLILTAILAGCVSLSQQNPLSPKPFEISRFKSSPGFYFEKTNDVFMTHSDWNVITHLNLQSLKNEFDVINSNLIRTKEFCYRKAKPTDGCRSIVSHLQAKMNISRTRNSLIFGNSRSKRSIAIPTLHFIGDIFGDLFGTLGSKFETQYADDLSLINKNEDHLIELLKNHTSILDSTLNFVKHNQKELQKHLSSFNDIIYSIGNETRNLEIESNLHNFLNYLAQIINEYDHQQTAIFNAITNSKRDHISHDLFTPAQMEAQIELITRRLGTEYRVPKGIDVYSVSKISVFRLPNQYIFKISIPLLKTQKFKLYKIISVPFIHNNKFYRIENNHRYLLTSVDRQLFQLIDNTANCIPYESKKSLICDKPTQWFTSGKSNCVWNIFNHVSKEECSVAEKQKDNFFESLKNNVFIFVIPEIYKITVICKDGQVTHDWLSGEGLLALNSDCSLGGENIQLISKVHFGDSNSEIIIPQMDSYNWTFITHIAMNTRNITHDTVEITQLQNRLNETTEHLHLIKSSNYFHNTHHYGVMYCAILTIISYFIYKRFVRARQTSQPVPMPRLSLSVAENVDAAT